MTQLSSKTVNTVPWSAMAEFRRRITFPTKLGQLLVLQNEVAKEYGLETVVRQGVLYPNVYTIGFKDQEPNSEVTEAFKINE